MPPAKHHTVESAASLDAELPHQLRLEPLKLVAHQLVRLARTMLSLDGFGGQQPLPSVQSRTEGRAGRSHRQNGILETPWDRGLWIAIVGVRADSARSSHPRTGPAAVLPIPVPAGHCWATPPA